MGAQARSGPESQQDNRPCTTEAARTHCSGPYSARNENYQTPEQIIPSVQQPFPLESCLTFSNTWGWNPKPANKSPNWVINTLAEVVAKGGCMVLNVGPDKNGNIDSVVYDRISVVGDWLKRNGDAIYSTRITPDYTRFNRAIGQYAIL